MYAPNLAAMSLAFMALAQASNLVTTVDCETELPTPSLNTVTFTVVAVVDPSISQWDQFLGLACPTQPSIDPFTGPGKHHDEHNGEPWEDHPEHNSAPGHERWSDGWYEVRCVDPDGGPPHHWYYDHHSRHPYWTGSLPPWPQPTEKRFSPGPSPSSTNNHRRPWPASSSGFPPRPIHSSSNHPEPTSDSSSDSPWPPPSSTEGPGPTSGTSSDFSVSPVPASTSSTSSDFPRPLPSSSDQPIPWSSSSPASSLEPLPSSSDQPIPWSSSSPDSSLQPLPSSTDQPRPEPSSSDAAASSSEGPGPEPSGSAEPSTPSTTLVTSTTTSASPTQTCEDISNGSFENNDIGAWFISDEMTAVSGIVQQGPDGVEYSFALIPSQQQYAQVYLNQYIPRCGDPPPIVDIQVSFSYQFTGNSEGCSIAASVNRSPDNLFTIVDDGQSPGVWQQYQGPVISVQLTYDPLFTVKLVCQEDTANDEAILITEISVYG